MDTDQAAGGVWLPQGEAERDLGLEAAPLRYPNHELLC